MSTVWTGGIPYCSVAAFLDYNDVRTVADLLQDQDQRLTAVQVAGSTRLARLLQRSSGELDAACLTGTKYAPADLVQLTTLENGTVTGVSSGTTTPTISTAEPITLGVGETVTIVNVLGATQVNGVFPIATVVGSNSFTIVTVTPTGTYVSGGTVTSTTLPNGGEMVQGLVADLALGHLYERRPDKGPPPDRVPRAHETLERIRNGERVFGILENQLAGLPSHHVDTPNNVFRRNGIVVVEERMYGCRVNQRGQFGPSGRGGCGCGNGGS